MVSEIGSNLVYETLRGDIVSGQLNPGERLVQDTIATELGTSRIPVRDALSRLQAEGLVTSEPHRGASVARVTVAELADLYEIRIALEPVGMRLCAEHATRAQLARLQRLVGEMPTRDVPPDIFLANERFLGAALQINPNRVMAELVTNLRHRTQRFRRMYATLPGRTRRMRDARMRLLKAMRARDLDAVEAISRASLTRSRDDLMEWLTQSGDASSRRALTRAETDG